MLACYVGWHVRQALLFDDEQLDGHGGLADPVAQAQSSALAKQKKASLKTKDSLTTPSFSTLMQALVSCCLCHCRLRKGGLRPPS